MNVFALILSFVLFLGGLALMAYSPEFALALRAPGFFAGIIAMSLSFGIPMHVWAKSH